LCGVAIGASSVQSPVTKSYFWEAINFVSFTGTNVDLNIRSQSYEFVIYN
jgi:hypothetical protein